MLNVENRESLIRQSNGRAMIQPLACFSEDDVLSIHDMLNTGNIRDIDEFCARYFPEDLSPFLRRKMQADCIFDVRSAMDFFYGRDVVRYELDPPNISKKKQAKPVCKEWGTDQILKINKDAFLASFYTLLCCENLFLSRAWEVVAKIFSVLKTFHSDEWKKFLTIQSNSHDDFDLIWKQLSFAVAKKIEELLSEKTCYEAYRALTLFRGVLDDEIYSALDKRSFAVFSDIAIERIDQACEIERKTGRLSWRDIEELFFFDEYLKCPCAEDRVKTRLHRYLLDISNALIAGNADVFFVHEILLIAFQCATNEIERKNAQIPLEKVERKVNRIQNNTMKKESRRKKRAEIANNIILFCGRIIFMHYKMSLLLLVCSIILAIVFNWVGLGWLSLCLWCIPAILVAMFIVVVILMFIYNFY